MCRRLKFYKCKCATCAGCNAVVSVRFRGVSYRELQNFVEQAVALAVEEGIGASCLGYSYPGQAGFLQRARDHRQHLLVSAYTILYVRMIGYHPDASH